MKHGRMRNEPLSQAARGVASAAILGLAVAACGELTAGGLGEATVLVTGGVASDDGGASAAVVAGGAEVVGTVTATLQVFVGNAGTRFVELTDGPRSVTVDIRGELEEELATRAVDVDDFTRVRLVYQQVTAVVESGLVVDGRPLTGPVRVRFGTDQARTAEQDAVFQVRDDRTSVMIIGLNAAAWLQAADEATREVDSNDFHGHVNTGRRGSDHR